MSTGLVPAVARCHTEGQRSSWEPQGCELLCVRGPTLGSVVLSSCWPLSLIITINARTKASFDQTLLPTPLLFLPTFQLTVAEVGCSKLKTHVPINKILLKYSYQ